MKQIIALCAAVTALATPASTQATTYYVDVQNPIADDGNDGSRSAPFRTIQRAADAVVPGDEVLVRPGVYAENVTLTSGGSAAAAVTFRGEPGAILDGAPLVAAGAYPGSAFSYYYWNGGPAVDFVRITGFEIRNYNTAIEVFGEFVWEAPELSTGGRGFVIDGNLIHDCYQGLEVVAGGSDPSTPTIVRENFLHANHWTDIHVHQFAVVERNVALSHAHDQNIRSCGSYTLPGAVHRVANNVVANGVNGILVAYPGSSYVNNVVMNVHSQRLTDWWNPEYATDWVGGFAFETDWDFAQPDQVFIGYNDVLDVEGLFGNAQEWDVAPSDLSSFVAGPTFSVDPMFVANTGDGSGDYHLTPGSPLVDAGDPSTPVPAGGGAVVDIGAYELGARAGHGGGLKPWTGPFTGPGPGARSLEAKLAAARRALSTGRLTAARNQLEALIREANAQAGKHLTLAEAARIVSEATGIIGSIPLQ